MDAKKELIEIVKANINVPGVFNDTLDKILEPALKAAVEKSATKIDDVVFNALYPILEEQLKLEAKKLWEGVLKGDDGDVIGEPV